MKTIVISAVTGFVLGVLAASQFLCGRVETVTVRTIDTVETVRFSAAEAKNDIGATLQWRTSPSLASQAFPPSKGDKRRTSPSLPLATFPPSKGDSGTAVMIVRPPHRPDSLPAFTATSDTTTFLHGDRIVMQYFFPENRFGVPFFQPAPDTSRTITDRTTTTAIERRPWNVSVSVQFGLDAQGIQRTTAGVSVGYSMFSF